MSIASEKTKTLMYSMNGDESYTHSFGFNLELGILPHTQKSMHSIPGFFSFFFSLPPPGLPPLFPPYLSLLILSINVYHSPFLFLTMQMY